MAKKKRPAPNKKKHPTAKKKHRRRGFGAGPPGSVKIDNFCDGEINIPVTAQLTVNGFCRGVANNAITCRLSDLDDNLAAPASNSAADPAFPNSAHRWQAVLNIAMPQAGRFLLEAFDSATGAIKDSMVISFS